MYTRSIRNYENTLKYFRFKIVQWKISVFREKFYVYLDFYLISIVFIKITDFSIIQCIQDKWIEFIFQNITEKRLLKV